MPQKPNLLFLFVDQMQGKALEPDNPCIAPNIDRLIDNDIRFSRSYTACSITSPSQASLMRACCPTTTVCCGCDTTSMTTRDVSARKTPSGCSA